MNALVALLILNSFYASAQPVKYHKHIPFHFCAGELRITADEIKEAYLHVINVDVDISIKELRQLLNSGMIDPKGFFLLPETGTVLRGQVQSALNSLSQVVFKAMSRVEVQQQFQVLVTDLIKIRENAKEVQEKRIQQESLVDSPARLIAQGLDVTASVAVTNQFAIISSTVGTTVMWDYTGAEKKPKSLSRTKFESSYLVCNPFHSRIYYRGLINVSILPEHRREKIGELVVPTNEVILVPQPQLNKISRVNLRDVSYLLEVSSFAPSSGGQLVVAGYNFGGLVYTWEEGVGQKGPFYFYSFGKGLAEKKSHPLVVINVPNTRKFLIGSRTSKEVVLWSYDQPNSAELLEFKTPEKFAVSENANQIALTTSEEKNTIVVYDLQSFSELKRTVVSGPVRKMAFSPNGKWVVLRLEDQKNLFLLRVKDMQIVAELSFGEMQAQGPRSVVDFQFLPDSKRLVVGKVREAWLVHVENYVQELSGNL